MSFVALRTCVVPVIVAGAIAACGPSGSDAVDITTRDPDDAGEGEGEDIVAAEGEGASSEGEGEGEGVVAEGEGEAVVAGEGEGEGAPVVVPDFAALPWETGPDVGFGVARKDVGASTGPNIAVVYGGFGSTLDAACAWTTALYDAALAARGVRHVFCVQGPSTVGYTQFEIGNSRIARAIVSQVQADTAFVLVIGHSSGTFVSHELLQQLASGFDAAGLTDGRLVYVNLDGGGGLTLTAASRLRRAYFVGARDGSTGTGSPNRGTMISLGATTTRGSFVDVDASASGCAPGAVWCVHMTPVVTRPHDPLEADVLHDYSDFVGRPVVTSWLDAISIEAGLVP